MKASQIVLADVGPQAKNSSAEIIQKYMGFHEEVIRTKKYVKKSK